MREGMIEPRQRGTRSGCDRPRRTNRRDVCGETPAEICNMITKFHRHEP